MISPFIPNLVRRSQGIPRISYGLSSFGYDIRLSPKDFRIFNHIPGSVVDPKRFNESHLEPVALQHDDQGSFFVLPRHSYGLGVAVERLVVPKNITVFCVGKSTYARAGVICNLTPAETRWEGYLTLEFSNPCPTDVRLYANEGIAQLLFLDGDSCEVTYSDRQGKYQNQNEEVTAPRV